MTLSTSVEISEKELQQLGAKNEEEEIEKFVTSNTQEISKDKWLCPLSGKKFKGPEFVKKHIFNKHIDKLDDVKKEVNLILKEYCSRIIIYKFTIYHCDRLNISTIIFVTLKDHSCLNILVTNKLEKI